MTKGHPPAGAVPDGKVMVFDQVMVLPALVAVILRVPPFPDLVKLAVSDWGGPGSVPAS